MISAKAFLHRVSLLVVALGFGLSSSRGADAVPLRDELKPLAPFLGQWLLNWTNTDGKKVTGKASFTASAAGTVILFTTEILGPDGKPAFGTVAVFSWRAETKTIIDTNYDSLGWHGVHELVRAEGSTMAWQGHGFGGNGKPGSSVIEVERDGSDQWSAQFVRQVYDGHPLPDGPKIIFTRVP